MAEDVMSLWSKKRKFDDKNENMWIKYFKGDETMLVLPEDASPELVSIVRSIPNPSVSKQKIYGLEEPLIDNRKHLVELFRYNQNISKERRDLVKYVHEHIEIVSKRNRVWSVISKVVVQTIFHFFYQYQTAIDVHKSPSEVIGGFGPELATLVNVALVITIETSEDLVGVLTSFFQNMIFCEDTFPVDSALAAFMLRTVKFALHYSTIVKGWPDIRTTLFVFTIQYFKTCVLQMRKNRLRDSELEFLTVVMVVVTDVMLTLKPAQYLSFIDMIADSVLEMFKSVLYTRSLGYERDALHDLCMTGLQTLQTIYGPGRPKKVSLTEKADLLYVPLFAAWCFDSYGFETVPVVHFPFVHEVVDDNMKDKYMFHTGEMLNDDLMSSMRFEKYPLEMLHRKCIDGLGQIVLFFRLIGNIDVVLSLVECLFTDKNVLKDVDFSNQELAPFYVVFVLCYFIEQFECVKDMTTSLDLFFHRYLFDNFDGAGPVEYEKRVFFRNAIFVLMHAAFRFTPRDVVGNLLAMLHSPISIGLEILLFFTELLHAYQDKFIECLSLKNILYLDCFLEEHNLPGREMVFVFLSSLISYRNGIVLLLSEDEHVQRLLECTLDASVANRAFSLLERSLGKVHELEYFVRFFGLIDNVLSQAIVEAGQVWAKYLVQFFSFVTEVTHYYRLRYGSTDAKFPKLVSTFVKLTVQMAEREAVEVLIPLLQLMRTFMKGDSGCRMDFVELYSLTLFPFNVCQSVIDEMLALIYEIPSQLMDEYHILRNPEALDLLHHSLIAYPEVHKVVFHDVFQRVRESLQDQLVLVRSSFGKEMLHFMHNNPEHQSYETFADAMGIILSNFCDLELFAYILKLGMTWNWESLITKVSEVPGTEISTKPFICLQGGDTEVLVKCQSVPVEHITVEFLLPCLPISSGTLLSLLGKDNSAVEIVVYNTGGVSVLTHARQSTNETKELMTRLFLSAKQFESLKLTLGSTNITLEIGGSVTVDIGSDFLLQKVVVGRSFIEKNSSLSVAVYNFSLRTHKRELFFSDCSIVENGQVVNLAETLEKIKCRVRGLAYQRKVSMAEPLLANGMLFDLVLCGHSTHSVVFIIRVLKNLMKNDPTFESRLFDFDKETSFWWYLHIIDKQLISEEFVAELDEMTSILREESNRFVMYDVCWFSFEVWCGTHVFDCVCFEVLPDIIAKNQRFVNEYLTVARFLEFGCDCDSFWHIVCRYLLQSEREQDFMELLSFVSEKQPASFFFNLFGLRNCGNHTGQLLRKIPPIDLKYYYQCFFDYLKENDPENIVSDSVLESLLRVFVDVESPPVVFDVLMLVSQHLPAKGLLKIVNVVVNCEDERLIQKMMSSELLSFWMTCIVLQQCDDIIDLNDCAHDITDLCAIVLFKSPLCFREFSMCLVSSAEQGYFEVCPVFHSIFVRACAMMLERDIPPETEVVSIILEYMFFVASNERYGKNIALLKEINESLLTQRDTKLSRLTLPVIIEFLSQSKDVNPCFLSNRLRITESGKWYDFDLAVQLLMVLNTADLSQKIQITDNQALCLSQVYAHLIFVMLSTSSETLKEARVQIERQYGEDWELMDDLSVRIILYGVFKRLHKGVEQQSDASWFISQFRQHLLDDAKLNHVPCETLDDMKTILASSFAESTFMWMRLLDNFCIVTYSKRNQWRKALYHHFPFTISDATATNIALDTTEFHVKRSTHIFSVKNVLQSLSKETCSGIPLLTRDFEPVSLGRSKFLFLAQKITDRRLEADKMLCPAILQCFDDTVETFFYANHDCVVVGGLKVNHTDIQWVVTPSLVEVEIYTSSGQILRVIFEDTETHDFVYNFLDRSQLVVVSGLTNMSMVIRLNIIHGNSYNSIEKKMIFPALSKSSLTTTTAIGPRWHFIWRMVNTMDLKPWFREFFMSSALDSQPLSLDHTSAGIELTSASVSENLWIFAHNEQVLCVVPGSDSDSYVTTLKCSPEFKVRSRTKLRMSLSSSMKLCFFDETAFFIYEPKLQLAKVFKKLSDGDEFKLISWFTVRNYVKSLLHVDPSRVVLHLSDNVICVVTLENAEVTTRRVFLRGSEIVSAAVNPILNMLATVDNAGNVILTSLSSFSFVKSVKLEVTNVHHMALLTYGVIAIERDDIIECFAIDGSHLSRTTIKRYRIFGVLGIHDQMLVVTRGDNELVFLDPFNLSPVKKVPVELPMKKHCIVVSESCVFAYGGKKLVRIQITSLL